MFFVLGSFRDPLADEVLLFVVELLDVFGWRHDVVRIIGRDALPDQRGSWITGNDSCAVVPLGKGTFGRVESKVGFARIGVESVAGETVV